MGMAAGAINSCDRALFFAIIACALGVVSAMLVTLYFIATLPLPHLSWFIMRNETSGGVDCVTFDQDTGKLFLSAPLVLPPGRWVFTNSARAVAPLFLSGMGKSWFIAQRLEGAGPDATFGNYLFELDMRLCTAGDALTAVPEINVPGMSQMRYHASVLGSHMVYDPIAGKQFTGVLLAMVAPVVSPGDPIPQTSAWTLGLAGSIGRTCVGEWGFQHGSWKRANYSRYCNVTGSTRHGGTGFVNAETIPRRRADAFTEFARLPYTSWKPADADGDFMWNYAGEWWAPDHKGRLFCSPGVGPPLASDAFRWPGSRAAAAPEESSLRDANGEVLAPVPRVRHTDADRPHLACIALENGTLVAHQPNILMARGVTTDNGLEFHDEAHPKAFLHPDAKLVGVGRCCDPAVEPLCPAECAGKGQRLNFFHWRPPNAPRVVHVFPANLSALGFHTLVSATVDPGRRRYVYLSGDGDVIIALDADSGRELSHTRFNASKYGGILAAFALPKPAQATADALSPMAKSV